MKTFDITSNTDWSVSSNQPWLSASPNSGNGNRTITVTAAANTGSTQRNATITVSGTGVATQYISVTQDANRTSIENVGNTTFKAYFMGDVLKVESSQAETITIYSISGTMVKVMPKNEGSIEIPFSYSSNSIWIVRGSLSGAIKVVK